LIPVVVVISPWRLAAIVLRGLLVTTALLRVIASALLRVIAATLLRVIATLRWVIRVITWSLLLIRVIGSLLLLRTTVSLWLVLVITTLSLPLLGPVSAVCFFKGV